MIADSRLIEFSYFTRSQKCTYAIDSAKKATVTAIHRTSCIILISELNADLAGDIALSQKTAGRGLHRARWP
jgi:hypothetical protein